MLTVIIIASAIIVGLIYIIYKLLLKYEQLEDAYNNECAATDEYKLWFESLSNTLHTIDSELHAVDSKGSFEADDEIGFFFKKIKELNKNLQEFKY